MAEEKKVFDVSKPGKTKAEPTSKPVIIGHKVAVTDGTVTSDKADESFAPVDPLTAPSEEVVTSTEESKLNPVGEKKLIPSDELIEQVQHDKASGTTEAKVVGETMSALPESEPSKDEAKVDEPEVKDETVASTEDSTDKGPTKPVEKPVGNESAVNTVLGEAGTVKEAEIAELQRQEKVKKLVKEGNYELPIGQAKHHHGKISFVKGLIVLVLVFLLTVAGFVLAVDAELIDSNYKLPFDLIKSSKTDSVSTPTPPVTTTAIKNDTNTSALVLPENWQWYENKVKNVKFAYPKIWGTVIESENNPDSVIDSMYINENKDFKKNLYASTKWIFWDTKTSQLMIADDLVPITDPLNYSSPVKLGPSKPLAKSTDDDISLLTSTGGFFIYEAIGKGQDNCGGHDYIFIVNNKIVKLHAFLCSRDGQIKAEDNATEYEEIVENPLKIFYKYIQS